MTLTPVLVVDGEDYATLLTCTPYMINSHRLLVRGKRIPMPEKTSKVNKKKVDYFHEYYWFMIAIAILLPVILRTLFYRSNKRKHKSR